MLENDKKKITIRVYYEDTDAGGVIFHASYLKYAERARTEFLRSEGFDHNKNMSLFGIILVIKKLNAELNSFGKLDDILEVETNVKNMSKAFIDFEQKIFKNNNIISLITSKVCSVTKKGKLVRLPDEIYKKLNKN